MPPKTIKNFSGTLPRRDATEEEADKALTVTKKPWPEGPSLSAGSPYRARFRQGATIVPRRFFVVEPIERGKLGRNAAAPFVRGRVSSLDKAPWNTVEPPSGPVEAQFISSLILGETILPFRLAEAALAIIPVPPGESSLLDSTSALQQGHRRLAAWLADIEAKWETHAAKNAHGEPKMTLRAQIDHMRKLSVQYPIAQTRVAYAKAGTQMAAAIVTAPLHIIDHKAYWTATRSANEARFLVAFLNSDCVRSRIAPMQSRGQWGERDIDKLAWELPIPLYDSRDPQHRALAAAAARAEKLAAAVPLKEGAHFTQHRRAIREALAESGVAAEIDALVEALLA